MISRRALLAAVPVLGVGAVVGYSLRDDSVSSVRMASGEPGAGYATFATTIASVTADRGNLRVHPVASVGSEENLALLSSGDVDVVLAQHDTLRAWIGEGESDLVALGRVYDNYVQVAVPSASEVRTIEDLRGRRVSTGPRGSGAAVAIPDILAVLGLEPGSYTDPASRLTAGARALADGSIDALCWTGSLPTRAVADAVSVRLLDIRSPELATFSPYYWTGVVRAGTYRGASGAASLTVRNILVSRADLADRVVEELLSAVVGNVDALVPSNATGLQNYEPRSMIDTPGVALHPAAVRWYRANG